MSPQPAYDFAKINEFLKGVVGREVGGYQFFFSEEGADKLIENNVRFLTSIFLLY